MDAMYYNSFDPQKYAQEQMYAYYQDCRELNKSIAKANAIEEIRIKGFATRQFLRQLEEERKKSTFDELIITSNGELQFVTRNLSFDAKPRSLTNMSRPTLTILKRANDVSQIIYLINCIVNDVQKDIFLYPEKLEKISYLKRKFACAGIHFHIPAGQIKNFFCDFISILALSNPCEMSIPDTPGYFEAPEKGLIYVGDDDFTWKKVYKLCK